MSGQATLELASELQIGRVCHFAPFRNIHYILPSGAILSSERVKNEHPTSYHPTDEFRRDGKLGHICASVEYPNIWYLKTLEERDDVYIDYGVFLIKPEILAAPGTLFCVRNAAGGNAQHVAGPEGLAAMYAPSVQGNQRWVRSGRHPIWLPTDMQAEVLIPDSIPLEMVTGVVVKSDVVAKRMRAQLEAAKCELPFPLLVSGGMFDRTRLGRLRNGSARPDEEPFPP